MGVQGHDDVALVEAARTGDPVAFGRLFDRWFDRTYDVAWHIVRNRDTAAEVAQDSFLAAWQQLPTLRQPASFGGWVLRIARNRALNRLERERRSVPSGDETVMAVLDGRADADRSDIAAELADQERDQLVWAAAAALGERDASLLDLHLRHELSAAAIAEELDTSTNNVHQLLHRLRGRLAGAIRSWVLWRDGQSRCEELAGALRTAGITRFGPEAVRVISHHAADCDVCSEAQRAVLAPEALFAAVPIVVAPVALKAQAAAALLQAGVPLGSAVSRMAPPSGSSGGASGSGGSSPGGSSGGAGPPGAIETPASGTPATTSSAASTSTTSTTAGAPVPSPAAAASGSQRSLRALRSAASARRLVVAGAAVMALVAAVVTGVVLSDGPTERGDGTDRAAEEADAGADGNGPVGDDRSDAPDASEISATPTTTTDGGPGDDQAPGDDAGGPGGPGGGGSDGGDTSRPVPPGGSGGSGGSDDPGTPPDGGTTTTTVPGGSPGSTTTTSTPPGPGADPPKILAFRAEVGARCGGLGLGHTVVLVWASLDAESASLGLLGLLGQAVPPSGSVTRCVLLGDVFLLTVAGPGGQAHAQLTIRL